jgi:hypothetical protein
MSETLSVDRAIRIGLLVVNAPVMVLLAVPGFAAYYYHGGGATRIIVAAAVTRKPVVQTRGFDPYV